MENIMPQLAKGGKFVFGWSIIGKNGCVQVPDKAIQEYSLLVDDKLILISGSKSSGGLAVSRPGLINQSIMKGLMHDNPEFKDYTLPEGEPIKWKGRHYCWVNISKEGIFKLPPKTRSCFKLRETDELLSIRGSNVAITMVVKGPLVEFAKNYEGTIKEYHC
ncbi:hypothetical protein [Methanobacterium ferruginis]|uniref:hypothetical protein n=1 Tax=Methanobacterium ferruginis TaxID=710191 RepID=UPI002573159D|nr:hypothetical protein [Methanobacterium ferruginis]BDZ68223.1 hypothetical protein GCM10025860_16710 [Methanobacterium ferruginis]